MLYELFTVSANLIVFLARRYESVALHSKISPVILKLIPVNGGRDSSVDVANDVWFISVYKVCEGITIGVLLSSKVMLGYSLLLIPFKLYSLFSV